MASQKKLRYAIVGLGHIAQVAVLPAFAHASRNSVVTAFVSDDPRKLRKLGARYGVEHHYSYDEYDKCLKSGQLDAVYIALPNLLHAEYSVRAARAGVHVLCEKPMAVTAGDCQRMIRAAESGGVALMIAYRLHFEAANLRTIELLGEGRIGDPRIFNSCFTMDVRKGDTRLKRKKGGGSLYDIGVYCINAARYLFRSEPTEVMAMSASRHDGRFNEVEDMIAATLRFPGGRLANFVCSFGASDVAEYRVIGTKGNIRLEPAYGYAVELKQYVQTGGEPRERAFAKRDQFAAELSYFSDCVLGGRKPEPSGSQGLIDVRIVEALHRSAKTRRPVRLDLQPIERRRHPSS